MNLIKEHLNKIIDYNYKDERKDFQEHFDIELPEDDLQSFNLISNNQNYRNHIFYSLLIIKLF